VNEGRRRVLDPVERVSEVLFGLIMVLTFTGSMSAASADRAEVREMLVGAIGCNLAWGIVDAVMYLMGTVLARGRGLAVWKAVRRTPDASAGRAAIVGALDPFLAERLDPAAIETLRQDLATGAEPPARPSIHGDDVRGAMEVFLLVFCSTLPVVVPFLLFDAVPRAMRMSNAVAVVMLCVGGYSLGRYSGLRPWATAAAMTGLGLFLVALTMALGG
jgi:hypothetical protein